MAEGAQCVLDTSALLAFLFGEPGGDRVKALLHGAAISTANWAEFFQKADERREVTGLREQIERSGVRIVPFSADQAEAAALLRRQTRMRGLSLGDRACLALARELGRPALTADTAWAHVDVGVDVQLVR